MCVVLKRQEMKYNSSYRVVIYLYIYQVLKDTKLGPGQVVQLVRASP